MNSIKIIILVMLSSQFLACSTTYYKAQRKITVGMDKSEVLGVMDNPKFTYRKNSKDYWVYRYYKNKIEQEMTVVFHHGEVKKRKGPKSRPSLLRQAEAAKNYKQYEKKIQQYQEAQN
ncbi:MAG: outer membrane protein assembly factor BamE [Bdellovibrionaceae bacterium]|nr:outer membrane protein assembly factor BamE [Pseudobdellovibrionaceae bacterium]